MAQRNFFPLKFWILPAVAVLGAVFCPGARAGEPCLFERFEVRDGTGTLPAGWKELSFKKISNQTRYSLAQDGESSILKAESRAGASGLLREIRADARKCPILRWLWKVDNVLERADARKKEGDDYAARVYVAFRYDPERAGAWEKAKYGSAKLLYGKYPPKGALNYVWDNKLPEGTHLDSAYTSRAKIVVVRSGGQKVGQWAAEERNVAEDYRRLFGEEPPEIAFVAVMTDTDNTGEYAVAYYDDLSLSPE